MFNREFRFCCLFVFALIAAFAVLSVSAENTGPGVAGFLKTLQDGNPQQREQAILGISALYYENEELGTSKQEVVAALRRHLKDQNQAVRQWAACILNEIEPSDKEGVPILIEALTSEGVSPKLREHVILDISGLNENEGLGAKKQEVVTALRHRLKDENHIVRQCAAYVLNKIEPADKEVIPVLIEALTERTDYDRRAMGAIGSFGPEAAAAVPAIVAVLKEDGGGLGFNYAGLELDCVWTLEKIGTPEAMEAIKPFKRKEALVVKLGRPFTFVSESIMVSSMGTIFFVILYVWSRFRRRRGDKIICWPLLIPVPVWGICVHNAFWTRAESGAILTPLEVRAIGTMVLLAATLAGIIPWLVSILRLHRPTTAPGSPEA